MEKSKLQMSTLSLLSLLCMIVGLMCWILPLFIPSLNPPLDKGLPIWLLIFIINPVGLLLGLVALKKGYPYSVFLVVGNLLMIFSIYPITIIGTLIFGP
jgi:hypothetical protein